MSLFELIFKCQKHAQIADYRLALIALDYKEYLDTRMAMLDLRYLLVTKLPLMLTETTMLSYTISLQKIWTKFRLPEVLITWNTCSKCYEFCLAKIEIRCLG